MSFMAMWFGKPPKIGSIYYLRGKEKDPFNRDKYAVTVADVKEGFVLYSFTAGNQDSLAVGIFNFYYIQEQPQ